MIDYRAPLDEMLFTLRQAGQVARLADWDDELATTLLDHASQWVNEVIAPLDPIGDKAGAHLVQGRVQMPPAFKTAYESYREGGWPGLDAPEEFGGQGLPHVLHSLLNEMMAGACITFEMVVSLAGAAARTIEVNGSAEQKARYLPLLASGDWLASMCLTESQAGSDLGLVRSLATPAGDGSWRISGGKIFISAGDQNLTGKVVHLVLARTPNAPPGLKGLSLFIAPSDLPDGKRNGIAVVRLEEKMGMHSSPTCQMAFDEAWAEMVGAPGEGLMRMFTMMNAERLDVSLQGVSLAEVAAQRSRAYVAQRKQGKAGKGGDGGPDFLHRHSDIRRMLLQQQTLASACRALVYRALVELELDRNRDLVEFLTPVCKAFCTEAGQEAAQLAIQTHGGYGFLSEYRVEQILRDGRITLIYEGTNGIQALTLVGRLLRLRNGQCAEAFRTFVAEAIAAAPPTTAEALRRALGQWDEAASIVASLSDPGLVATSFMRLTGLLASGAALSSLEAAADRSPNPARILAITDYFRDWLLPETAHLARQCAVGLDLGALAEEVFVDA